MKRLRLLLIIIGVVVLAAVVVPHLFTLNQFKQLAAQKVEEVTGRKLEIAGDIRLSLFPVLGATVEKVSLSNMPGSEYPTMFSVEEADVGVKLVPLLGGKVELQRIVLKRPMVYLEKDANGNPNWKFKEPVTEAGAAKEPEKKQDVSLSGISIKDGSVTYHDRQGGSAMELADVNLEANLASLTGSADVDLSAKWQGMPVRVEMETDSIEKLMSEAGSDSQVKFSVYGIGGELKGLTAITPASAGVKNMELKVGDIVGKGEAAVALGGEVPVVNAALAFGEVNLKPLMALSNAGGEKTDVAAKAQPNAQGKNGLMPADEFKAVNGKIALTAQKIIGDGFVVENLKANTALNNGNVTIASEGILAQDGQEKVAFAANSNQLEQILSGNGGDFAAKAKRGDLNVAASGNLGLGPKKVNWQNAVLKLNDQTMQGRVLADFGGAKPKVQAALAFDVLDVEKLKSLAGKAAPAGEGAAAAKDGGSADMSWINTLDADVNVKAGTLLAGGQRVEGLLATADTGTGSLKASASGTWMKDKDAWRFSAESARLEKIMTSEGGPFAVVLQSAGQTVRAGGTASYTPSGIRLNPLNLVTNGGQGKGSVAVNTSGAKPDIDVDMQFGALDLNPLMSLAGGDKQAAKAQSTPQAKAKAESPLNAVNAKVRFKAQQLKVKEIVATNAALNLDIKDGNMDITVPDVGLYGGTANLAAKVVDEKFSAVTKGKSVNLGSLLKGGAGTSALQGIGDWNMEFTGNGLEAPALYRTLNGKGDFLINDMVISGMDILTVASQIRGLSSKSVVKQDRGSNHMVAKGTFLMEGGVAKIDDMEATGPNMQMKGAGNINLPAWTINFRLDPKVGETRQNAAGEQKFIGTNVPVIIEGSLDQPRVYPDPKALLKTGLDALGTVKELGIGDKVKGLDKVLSPFLGGQQQPAPTQQPQPAPSAQQPAPQAPATQGAPIMEQPQQQEQRQPNPVEQIQQLQKLFGK